MTMTEPEKHNRKSASYTKRGPGRLHRSGEPRTPFLGVAEVIKPERVPLYLHSCARFYVGLRAALATTPS
jgi:hypothetical protein